MGSHSGLAILKLLSAVLHSYDDQLTGEYAGALLSTGGSLFVPLIGDQPFSVHNLECQVHCHCGLPNLRLLRGSLVRLCKSAQKYTTSGAAER